MTFMINRRRLISGTAQASFVMAMATIGDPIVRANANPERHGPSPLPAANATPRQVAESYWRAECDRDIERVGRHYHPDATFMAPGVHLVGWSDIRKWYEDSFRQYPGVDVQIVHEIRHENEAALEWKAVLIDVAKARHPVTGVNLVRVEGGKFREVKAYFDSSSLTRQPSEVKEKADGVTSRK